MNKFSYALGMSMGNNFLASGIKELNVEDFCKGISAVMASEKTDLSYDEAKEIINSFFQNLQNQVADQNIKIGESFLAANGQEEGVVTLASGLQYKVLKEGNGEKPKATDQVKCHYHGSLLDGTVFDSSVERGEPAVFGVNQVIQGWVEALQLMNVGSKWQLFIPSDLAYGERGAGQAIAPHSTLIFEVELLEIV